MSLLWRDLGRLMKTYTYTEKKDTRSGFGEG